MIHERRPWLTVVPWSQVLGPGGVPWTVLPHWPLHERRVIWPGAPLSAVFTPAVTDLTTVLVPEEGDAVAALAATFGMPELIAWQPGQADPWYCPQQALGTVEGHLRDWHGSLELGTTYHRTGSVMESLAYHDQLHQQQLVHPLPMNHIHIGG